MRYDFDREIDRRRTNSAKWEFIQSEGDLLQWEHTDRFFGEGRTLPMWVADMDFACPKPVVEALVARAAHGIYGYTAPTESYDQALIGWMRRRQGWEISREWICFSPGVVPALCMLVQAFTNPGEAVLIQPPVYYPFFSAIAKNGAVTVTNPLILESGRYRMDYDDLARKAADPRVKMAILCSPHNPISRVWSRQELQRFAEICLEHDILIVSDEIHGDLILPGHTFTPFAALGGEMAEKAIICTAPSKTFNLAGLHTSNIIVPDADLRARFRRTLDKNGVFDITAFGLVALEAAYNQGEDWLTQVLEYLQGNVAYLREYVATHIPQISVIEPEGTYLVWLDCRRLGLGKLELKHLMLKRAKVYLDEGYIFGEEGEGFERINIACPRSVLAEALERIRDAIASL
ncbi:MAG: pyridoxal phosphate-dependent aminotransferase [Anaerolineales bacterium]|nr:pyridoxal phosphate-dependent aminotransferase [Anaerolineales bacterium]